MRSIFSLFAIGLLTFAVSSPARAGLTVSGEVVNVQPGDLGKFIEIHLTNTGLSAQTLSSFQVNVALSGTGIVFQNVFETTNVPFVFAGVGSGVLTFDVFPNTGFFLSDVYSAVPPPTAVTIAAGATVGLGRIEFDVAAGAIDGFRHLVFDSVELVDGDSIVIDDVVLVNGTIIVGDPNLIVPEPASLVLFSLGGAGMIAGALAGRARKRRG